MNSKRIIRASGAALAGLSLVGIVALLVSLQSPDAPEQEIPVITVPPAAEPPPAEEIVADEPPAVPDVAVEEPPAEEIAADEPPAEPDVTVEEIATEEPPTEVEIEVEEVATADPVPELSMPEDAPDASTDTDADADADADAAPAEPAPAPPASHPLGETPFHVEFASIEDLAGLVEDTHVILVLEYPDGRRYRLPQRLLTNRVTLPVPDDTFAAWLGAGRVSELVPTTELRQRLSVYGPELRYLAVLDVGLRDRVADLAGTASDDDVVLTIARGPVVRLAGS